MRNRVYLSAPHLSGIEKTYIEDALVSNWIAPLGPHVDAFEKEVSEYVGVSGALALNSGTSAIHLALKLLGIEQGDYIFCSSLTFVASANPILYEKATPVFIDSDKETWNMSPSALYNALEQAASIGKVPKAVIVVNLYGQSADYDEILTICEKYRVPVIEDAAESLGATYKGKPSGSLGDYGIFSFNGNKIITASGGGMLVSNDSAGIDKARFWSTQSRDPALHYEHSQLGYNYRMSNICAAIGRGQLTVLEDRVSTRRRIFDTYQSVLGEYPGISFMPEASYGNSNRWLTVALLDPDHTKTTPVEIINELAKDNIEARPVWKPLHRQPLFSANSYYPHKSDESVSDFLFARGVCLPSGTNLSDEEMDRVVQCVERCISKR